MKVRNNTPFILAVLVVFCVSGAVFAQEDLKKKYEPILGDYEFDMSEAGMGIMIVNFYFEDGSCWAWPETSDQPAQMTPVEGKEFGFVIETPDEGTWKISFLKDDAGKYTKCHAVNEMQGMDINGVKVKK